MRCFALVFLFMDPITITITITIIFIFIAATTAPSPCYRAAVCGGFECRWQRDCALR
jgi:hypothetical protein